MAGGFLLKNQTTNGSGDALTILNKTSYVHFYTVVAYGTWDTATLTLQISPDDGTTWIAHSTGATFTDNGHSKVELGPGIQLRGTVSSVGTGTDLNLKIF